MKDLQLNENGRGAPRPRIALFGAASLLTLAIATPAMADEAEAGGSDIIVTGTRRADRSLAESSVPVDVVSARALESVASSDLLDKLAQTLPSFTVQTRPLYGNQMFIRPVALRNLGADDTLVLVNGKRVHRSAFVNYSVFGQASQAVDLSQIPAQALERVEVLRDGASAQYGSDAIAGVVNLILKSAPGYSAYAQLGQFYAGDGLRFQTAANAGWKIGDRGSLNITFEYTNSKYTSRSYQRAGAAALAAAGNTNIRNPVTRWGDPDTELYRGTYNLAYELGDDAEFYSYGLYGHSWGENNTNWRSPTSAVFKRSVFQNSPYNLYPTYDAVSRFPGGFTPLSTLVGEDLSLAAGLRGKLGEALRYDASVNWGYNKTSFGSRETLNASLGPLSPTSFDNGWIRENEFDAQLDFVWLVDVGLVSPLNIAFGAQYRNESYSAGVGDAASYAIGPFADLQSGANGTTFVTPDAVGSWSRPNGAAYVDIDADLSSRFNLGLAARFEHYSDFGSTLTGKASARFVVAPGLSLRGSVSTGFRAPTPGQINSVSSVINPDPFRPGSFNTVSLIPATNPIARALGAQPLKPSKSFDVSLGAVAQPLTGLTVTLDYYNITLRDRLTSSQLFGTSGNQYNFLVNGYRTRTQGVDLVTSWERKLGGDATLLLTLAGNFNDTKVTGSDPGTINAAQKLYFERKMPRWSGVLSADFRSSRFSATARARYYGSTVDVFFENIAWRQTVSPETFIDLSATYNLTRSVSLTAGADNLLGSYPDKAFWGGPVNAVNTLDFGRVYPSALPYSFNGGFYYGRVTFKF